MIINFGLMFFSLAMITLFRPLALKIRARMFSVSGDYLSMAFHAFLSLYKLLVFFFVVIPWIALKIIGV